MKTLLVPLSPVVMEWPVIDNIVQVLCLFDEVNGLSYFFGRPAGVLFLRVLIIRTVLLYTFIPVPDLHDIPSSYGPGDTTMATINYHFGNLV